MIQEEQHLNLLSVFHYVLGCITALFSCIFLIHIIIGIAMLTGKFEGDEQPPRFLGWLFIIMPSLFILASWTFGAIIIAAGRRLKRRTSYMFCFVIACIECVMMPFGTVLGIFTIITLMKEPVKEMFSANQISNPMY